MRCYFLSLRLILIFVFLVVCAMFIIKTTQRISSHHVLNHAFLLVILWVKRVIEFMIWSHTKFFHLAMLFFMRISFLFMIPNLLKKPMLLFLYQLMILYLSPLVLNLNLTLMTLLFHHPRPYLIIKLQFHLITLSHNLLQLPYLHNHALNTQPSLV